MRQHLTDKEEEIMNLFWENGPLYVRELVEQLPGPKRHFNTVSTFVRLMEQKGFVGHELTGNSYRYFATISRNEYSRSALKSVISKYFNNSLRGVISALVEEENLTDDEVRELVTHVRKQNAKEPKP